LEKKLFLAGESLTLRELFYSLVRPEGNEGMDTLLGDFDL
jgi:hypothetical protein